jgi:hypothetical protein
VVPGEKEGAARDKNEDEDDVGSWRGWDGIATYFQCARFASVKAVLSVAVLVSCNEVPWLSA